MVLKSIRSKDSEINVAPLCLDNVSKHSVIIMKNTELYGYVYDFSVDYDSIDPDNILDI